MWVSLPSSGALGWEAQLGVENPHFSGATFAAEIFFQNLSHFPWEQGQPFSSLHPSNRYQYGFFCKFLVIDVSAASVQLIIQVDCFIF